MPKLKKRKSATAREPGATPERLALARGDLERGDLGIITMRDSPIERALAREVISRPQYEAAIKFRHHWYHGGLAPMLASPDLNRVFAPNVANYSGMAKSESQVFHRQRYREAVSEVGRRGEYVLSLCVCEEQPLAHAGYGLGWEHKPQAVAVATELLRLGLDRLCALWSIGP